MEAKKIIECECAGRTFSVLRYSGVKGPQYSVGESGTGLVFITSSIKDAFKILGERMHLRYSLAQFDNITLTKVISGAALGLFLVFAPAKSTAEIPDGCYVTYSEPSKCYKPSGFASFFQGTYYTLTDSEKHYGSILGATLNAYYNCIADKQTFEGDLILFQKGVGDYSLKTKKLIAKLRKVCGKKCKGI